MKKSHNIKGIILAVVMLLLIVGYYYYLSNRNVSQAEDADRELQTLTATQEVLTRDLETNYPPTPREVVKYFSQITQCFYNEDNTEEEIKQLGHKIMELYDEELIANQDEERYLSALKKDIEEFKEKKRTIVSYVPSSSVDVETFTKDGYDWARLYCIYGIKQDGLLYNSNIVFILKKDTGDPCIYGAIQEQMAFFDRYKMSYHITPGISSFQAAAAALRSQFTIPEKVQSIILTRGEGRTPMPEKEQLHKLAQSQSTMCIYLSAGIVEQVQEELMQAYPPETPVAACYKLTWKEEKIYRGELKDLAKIVRDNNLTLTTLLVVGEAIDNRKGLSRLYAHEFKHLFRK